MYEDALSDSRFMARFTHRYTVTLACWPWEGTLDNHGYGVITFRKGVVKAHRVMYELYHGPLPVGAFVTHTCNKPRCVNPDHLKIGTPMSNVKDKIAAGTCCRGEGHVLHKLTIEQVRDIRAGYAMGESLASMAREYHVTTPCIWQVVHRKSWTHIR